MKELKEDGRIVAGRRRRVQNLMIDIMVYAGKIGISQTECVMFFLLAAAGQKPLEQAHMDKVVSLLKDGETAEGVYRQIFCEEPLRPVCRV